MSYANALYSFLLTEGTWVWTDGSVMEWSNFLQDEPRNSDFHNCLSIVKNQSEVFKWSDSRCPRYKKFICEKNRNVSGTYI